MVQASLLGKEKDVHDMKTNREGQIAELNYITLDTLEILRQSDSCPLKNASSSGMIVGE